MITHQTWAQEKYTVAILDLEPQGVSQSEAISITNLIRNELFLTGQYTVVERDNMAEIFKEQGFQIAGCTTSECIIRAGRVLGVQRMVAGSLDKLGSLFIINLRLIDVETGEIVSVARADCMGSIEQVAVKSTKSVVQDLTGAKIPREAVTIIPPKKEKKPIKSENSGIKVGLNRSTYSGVAFITTQCFGLYTNIYKLLKVEVLFTQKGGLEDNYEGGYLNSPSSFKFTLNYIEIPLLIRMKLYGKNDYKISILGGSYYAFFFAQNITLYGYDYNVLIEKKGFNNDWGFILGFELEKYNFTLDFRATQGIPGNNNGAILYGPNFIDYSLLESDWQNFVFTLSLGYIFF
jgi:TolB-like protein